MPIVNQDIKNLYNDMQAGGSAVWYKDSLEVFKPQDGTIIWHAGGPIGLSVYNPKTGERKALNFIERVYLWWGWKKAKGGITYDEKQKHKLLIEAWDLIEDNAGD